MEDLLKLQPLAKHVVAKIKDKKEVDLSMLNDEQEKAFNMLKKFLSDKGADMFLLEGYAGTGKTFLVTKFIEWFLNKNKYKFVAMTAPTNKAVKVLRTTSSFENKFVEFSTIHKLLGLREDIDAYGKQQFIQSKMFSVELDKYKVLVVDEVSMLNDDLFTELLKWCKVVKIIFMGDPAQIPPVNNPDCIPMVEEERKKHGIRRVRLETIMRQNVGNPLVEIGFKVRDNLKELHPYNGSKSKMVKGAGVWFFDPNDDEQRKFLAKMFKQYFDSKQFKEDADFAKVIAWTNKTVRKYNDYIRGLLFGEDAAMIEVGEKLIANEPIMANDLIIFSNNDEFEVVSFKTMNKVSFRVGMKYYATTVKYIDAVTQQEKEQVVDILHEDSVDAFNDQLKSMKQQAVTQPKGSGQAKQKWVLYYKFMRTFANVNYNYAITSHKAQGSTYENVFVVDDDLNNNKNVLERNRIRYTAFSRPRSRLFVLKRGV